MDELEKQIIEQIDAAVQVIQYDNSPALYLQDKAAIDVQVATAHAFPRNIKRATDNALAIVTMDEETARSCHYAVPRAGKTISGPSVHLARIIAQAWGNLRIDSRVVSVDDRDVTSESVCLDLESNLAIKVSVKRRIIDKKGSRFSDDMIIVTGNAANAIALRNAILQVIPKSVIQRLSDAAKAVLTGDLSDKQQLIRKRAQIFTGIKDSLEVTEKEILGAINRESLDHVTGEDLFTLISLAQAIKDGDSTIDGVFRQEKNKAVAPKLDKTQKEIERAEKLLKATKSAAEVTKLWNSIPGGIKEFMTEAFAARALDFEGKEDKERADNEYIQGDNLRGG